MYCSSFGFESGPSPDHGKMGQVIGGLPPGMPQQHGLAGLLRYKDDKMFVSGAKAGAGAEIVLQLRGPDWIGIRHHEQDIGSSSKWV
jgi:hypothetical protein